MKMEYVDWRGYVIELDDWTVKFSELKADKEVRNNQYRVLMQFFSKKGEENWEVKLTRYETFGGRVGDKNIPNTHLKSVATAYLKYRNNKDGFVRGRIKYNEYMHDNVSVHMLPGSHDFTLYIETDNQGIFDIPEQTDEYGHGLGSRLLATIAAKDIEEAKQKARERIDLFIAHLQKCKELIK